MAGQPKTRERMQGAETKVSELSGRLDRMRIALLKAGQNPNDYDLDTDALDLKPLDHYQPRLPAEVIRLARQGKQLEEIRALLGFSDGQEAAWCEKYVDFSSAVVRARELNRAFWEKSLREASESGDRSAATGIMHLIDKRFYNNGAQGNAGVLLHLRAGQRRAQPVAEDE